MPKQKYDVVIGKIGNISVVGKPTSLRSAYKKADNYNFRHELPYDHMARVIKSKQAQHALSRD